MTHRIARGVSLLALLLAPALGSAQARGTRTATSAGGSSAIGAPLGAYDYSFLLALDLPPGGFSVGPRLTGEIMYGYADVAPQARVDLGLRGSFAYHSADFDSSLWIFEVVPDAKLVFALSPQLAVYGDVGLGLALLHLSGVTVTTPFQTFTTDSDTTVALAIQFGGGVAVAVAPNMNLLGEIRFDFYTRSGSSTFVALPTIGLQWH
ncbi:MAG: outer membrane protein [Anaeromyxobacteraceae bacterium]